MLNENSAENSKKSSSKLIIIIFILSALIVIIVIVLIGVFMMQIYTYTHKSKFNYNRSLKTCGLTSPNRSHFKRIINGYNTSIINWPWIASIRLLTNQSSYSEHICAGTLIDPDFILTAAHCIAEHEPSDLIVIIGVTDFGSPIHSSNMYYVSKFVYHSNYNLYKINEGYDIALLRLKSSVKLSAKVSTVCLPYKDVDLKDDVTLIGWGSVDGSRSELSLSKVLKQTSLNLLNDKNICNKDLDYDSDRIYCAIDSNKNKSSNICYGDSGGPLLYKMEGKWHIFGVSSYVLIGNDSYMNLACLPFKPSYHTKVSKYVDWLIEKKTKL